MESKQVGTITVEILRQTGMLDMFQSDSSDVVAALGEIRPISEIGRIQEYVRKIMKDKNIKGKVNMFGVSVYVGEKPMTCEHYYEVAENDSNKMIQMCRYIRGKVDCGGTKDECKCPEAWGVEEDERRG